MEKQKFYTPFVDEFHYGFEYEQKTWILDESTFPKGLTKELYYSIPFSKRIRIYPEVEATSEWVKRKWLIVSDYKSLFDSEYDDEIIDKTFVKKGIRVKHLDQQDIIDLGFEEDKKLFNTLFYHDVDFSFSYEKGKHKYLIFLKDEIYHILKVTDMPELALERPVYIDVFRGKIKNKSELKRLLTQIGVL